MSGDKVVVVTGANKGIGYQIVRQLAKEGKFRPVLAGREPARVAEAQQKLKEEGLDVDVAHVDLNNPETATQAASLLQEKYGKIYGLVNNAGIFLRTPEESLGGNAEETINVNYFGTLAVSKAFFPILEDGGRVLILSSRMGDLAQLSQEKRDKLNNPELTEDELSALTREFVENAKADTTKANGWPASEAPEQVAYRVSKIATTVLARVLARAQPNLIVAAICPGWCKTDMGSDYAPNTPESGADTAVWALSAEGLESGGLFAERKLTSPENTGF